MTFDKSLIFLAILEHLVSELTLFLQLPWFLCKKSSPKVVKNQWIYQKVWNLLSKVVHIFAAVGHRRKYFQSQFISCYQISIEAYTSGFFLLQIVARIVAQKFWAYEAKVVYHFAW